MVSKKRAVQETALHVVRDFAIGAVESELVLVARSRRLQGEDCDHPICDQILEGFCSFREMLSLQFGVHVQPGLRVLCVTSQPPLVVSDTRTYCKALVP